MFRVLLIEKSPTMRHSLAHLLKNSGIAVHQSRCYAQGLKRLCFDHEKFDAVIIGCPHATDTSADDLLRELSGLEYRDMAAILLTQNSQSARFDFVTGRDKTTLLHWDNYRDTVITLEALLPQLQIVESSNDCLDDCADSNGIKILFVDDSPTVRMTYRKLLKRNGYCVDIAGSVAEGMELALESSYDIAIVDYFMDGGNGDQLCQQLREHPNTSTTTTAIITGTYLDSVIKDSLEAGAIECLFKNESEALFLARVDAMSRSIINSKTIDNERRHLQSILSSVGDGVYGVGADGRVTFLNPAAQNILGCTEADIVGRTPYDAFHFADKDGTVTPKNSCYLSRAYATGDPMEDWQTVFWTQHDAPIPVECTVHPLYFDGKREGSVVAFRDVSERKLMEEELRWQAHHDSLTKLQNRHAFEQQLEQEVDRLKRSEETSALLYIDLDRFKYINDTAGHSAGDKLLLEVSQQLQSRLRISDTLARIGGDEFAVILRNIKSDAVAQTADSFRDVLDNYLFVYDGKSYRVNCSIGVALMDEACGSPGEVLATADVAVHTAKEKGRNQVHVFSESNETRKVMDKDLGWSVRLHQALEKDLFQLVFQPIIPMHLLPELEQDLSAAERWEHILDAVGDTPLCCETLIRLQGPEGRLILPGAFLPAAERFNIMPRIDHWVIENSIKELARVNANSKRLELTINLSGQTIVDDSLPAFIKSMIMRHRVDPRCLTFEITESCAISNIDAAQRLISELREIGCRFALDDFGSGFCSFGHLKNLDVDIIKIDGIFTRGIVSDCIDRQVIIAISQIAQSLGKQTVAEFVESEQIVEQLKLCGIDYAQGYHISEPLLSLPNPVPLKRKKPKLSRVQKSG